MWVWDSRRKWSTFCSWLFQSVCLASLSHRCVTDRPVEKPFKGPPGVALSNCLFSASAIVTKALCERPSWILCAFYFMVITIVIILLSLSMFFLFCFLSADDYLNAKKFYDENEKKKRENLNIWSLDWRWLELPPRLDINKRISVLLPPYLLCSLLHSHTMMMMMVVGGWYRTDLPPLPALCSLSQILLGERSFDLISGDSFFLEKEKPV